MESNRRMRLMRMCKRRWTVKWWKKRNGHRAKWWKIATNHARLCEFFWENAFTFAWISSRQICEVLHSIRGNKESLDDLCETIYLNTKQLFFPWELIRWHRWWTGRFVFSDKYLLKHRTWQNAVELEVASVHEAVSKSAFLFMPEDVSRLR